MVCRTSFKIVEQETGKRGWVQAPLYENDFMYICQRTSPNFTTYGDNGLPTLYLRGCNSDSDELVINCGPYIYEVLCALKKAFDDFTILNCNKFVLEK